MSTPEEAEKQAALIQPAVYINRFIIAVNGDMVRLACMEIGNGGAMCRYALIMTRHNAKELTNLLQTMLAGENEGRTYDA
jgi:hypothetical protein